MEKDMSDERDREKVLTSEDAENILNDYSCGLTCMVCPFPGGKCNKKNSANLWRTSSDPWRQEKTETEKKEKFQPAPGICTEIEFEMKDNDETVK